MVDPSQLITALQGLISQISANTVPGPQGSPAAFGAGRSPQVNQQLPTYWGPESFSGGTRTSPSTIDLGPGGNACVVYIQPVSGSAAVPATTITVKTAGTPTGPWITGLDSSAIFTATGTAAQSFLVTSLLRYVQVQANTSAGEYSVWWSAAAQPSSGVEPQALYDVGSTGVIAGSNVLTSLTVSLSNVQGGGAAAIFDGRQAMLTIANVSTGQSITGATLRFSDTTPGGLAVTHDYTVLDASGGAPSIASGADGFYVVPLGRGVYKNVSVIVTYSVAPVAGQIDVILELQAGGVVTPSGLVTAAIDTATSGDNTLVAAVAGVGIAVVSYVIVATGAVSVQWKTSTPSNLSGAMALPANGGISANITPPAYVLGVSTGLGLILNLSGNVQVSGHLTYYKSLAIPLAG